MLAQKARAKTVNGADLRAGQGFFQLSPVACGISGRNSFLDLFPEALCHLRGRLVSEGDGHQLREVCFFVLEDLHQPADENFGFSAAGAGHNAQTLIQRFNRQLLGRRPLKHLLLSPFAPPATFGNSR